MATRKIKPSTGRWVDERAEQASGGGKARVGEGRRGGNEY